MRHIQENIVTFQVQKDVESLNLKKGDLVRYQGTLGNNNLYVVNKNGTIDHNRVFSSSIVIDNEDTYKKVANNFLIQNVPVES